MAKKLDVSEGTIRMWENGKTSREWEWLKRFLVYLMFQKLFVR